MSSSINQSTSLPSTKHTHHHHHQHPRSDLYHPQIHPSQPSPHTYQYQQTFQNLIKRIAGMTTKPFSQSVHDHYHPPHSAMISLKDSDPHHCYHPHPLNRFISNLFVSQPTLDLVDPSPSPLSSIESDDLQPRPDSLILDGFLKNNGGYLDESDSSDCSDSQDGRDPHHPLHPPSKRDRQNHHIKILSTKYQNEDKSSHPGHLRHHHHHAHRHPSTNRASLPLKPNGSNQAITIHQTFYPRSSDDNQQDDHLSILPNRTNGSRHSCYSNRHFHPPRNGHSDRMGDVHQRSISLNTSTKDRHHQLPIDGSHDLKMSDHSLPHPTSEIPYLHRTSSLKHQPRHYHHHHHHSRSSHQEEDGNHLNINQQYIQSSTFPIKNSIIVDPKSQSCQPLDRHRHQHARRVEEDDWFEYTPTDGSHSNLSSDLHPIHHRRRQSIDSLDPRLAHLDHNKKFKSPFRSLVLGQDDLLRSNQ